jgi:hypothetical protein
MKNLTDFNLPHIFNLSQKHQTLQAESLLEQIPLEYRHDEWLLAKAKCCINFEDYQRALVFLTIISDNCSRKVQKAFLKCYEELRDYTNASIIYSRFCLKDEKITTLMKMINCFKKLNNYPYLHYLFQNILELNPSNLEIRYAFCQFLMETNDASFIHILNDYILRWPLYIKFQILNIEWNFKQKNHAVLHHYILNIIHNNPFFIDANLLLLKFYIEINSPRQALMFEQACRMRFQQTLTVDFMFQQVNQQHDCLHGIQILNIPKSLRILPEIIQKGFEMVFSEGAVCYLVGSTVHYLINGQEKCRYHDLDFTTNTPPQVGGFNQNHFFPKLYTARIKESIDKWVKLDCYVSYARTDKFLEHDCLTRDFTINALYCDAAGQLFDPTGMGYDDFINKQLRTICPSGVSFAKDPIRLVRALKLIHQGYMPTDELEFALYHWQPKDNIHRSHLIAVTKKTISIIGIQAYVELIKKYNLASKLYGLNQYLDNDQLGLHLNRLLYSSYSIDAVKPSFFHLKYPHSYTDTLTQTFPH